MTPPAWTRPCSRRSDRVGPSEAPISPERPNCPSCGAPLPSRNPGIRAQTCEYCGTISLWDEEGHRDSGKKSMLPEGFSRLYRGARGQVRGRGFEVLGRVRYGHARGFWDEWFLRYDDGETGWLTEDDSQLALESKLEGVRLEAELDVGKIIVLNEVPYLILEVGQARCLGIEGQVPRGILPDETYGYADGSSVDGTYSLGIEYDETPPTIFTGERLQHEDVQLDDEGEAW